MSAKTIVHAVLGIVATFAVAGAVATSAADEFPPGQLSLGKLRFGQQAKSGRDSVVLPGSSRNFFSLTPDQVSSASGGTVTLKINDYCRTFGPLVLGGASRAQLKSSFTDPATGEKYKAAFSETSIADRFKLALSVKNTEHGFPSGSFPRAPKAGDPSPLVATLVVGGVGGTWDVLNGTRLPFVDPGLQAASEELPDRNGLDLQDVWTFEGRAGDRVSFRVDTVGAAPSGLDLAAELIAPDGQTILKKADDEFDCTVPTACGFACPEVSGFVLPEDGTYSIVVHDFGDRGDGCDTGGAYTLSISEPACTGATLAYDRDRAICGDDVIGPGEDCEQASDCGAGESCSSACQCEPLCGNGTIDPGEQCEQAADCASGEVCDACSCTVPPLGTRTMTIRSACSYLDTSLSPIRKPGTASGGTIVLKAGPVDANGVATVTVDEPTFLPININLVSQTLCTRLGPCTGHIACSGGVNVNVLAELDSLNPALTCEPNGASCTNACEGFGNPHSGNALVFSNDPNALPASPAGSLILTCEQAVTSLSGLGGDCAAATYDSSAQVTFTTGSAQSRITNHCAGSGAPAATVPQFGGTGVPFSCASWTTTDGPGTIVLAVPAEEPNSSFTGDGANLFAFCD